MHKGERRGVLLLMVVLSLLLGRVVHMQWFGTPEVHDLSVLEAEMQAWVAEVKALRDTVDVAAVLFPFDPNAIGREEWVALGLRERQADGIERYKAKGGRFRVKRDVARLYGLAPGDYERLEPYIMLPDSLPRRPPRTRVALAGGGRSKEPSLPREGRWNAKREPIRKVEVNSADSAELVALPGIGPSFARSILAYRDRLGGYLSMEQLAEVYVLKDKPDALARMQELLVIDTLMVRRIPINTCTVEELAAHPYIRWKLAKPLIAYRQQHGPFATLDDIRGCHLIDGAAFRKLAPYLTVE